MSLVSIPIERTFECYPKTPNKMINYVERMMNKDETIVKSIITWGIFYNIFIVYDELDN